MRPSAANSTPPSAVRAPPSTACQSRWPRRTTSTTSSWGSTGPEFRRLDLAGPYESLLGPDGIAADLKHGCASVPLCLVACGRLHAYAAMWLELEDTAAAFLINREAGARVTTFRGEEWRLGDRSILTANPALHAKILERIR